MFAFGRFQELRIDCLSIENPFFGRIFKEFSTSLDYAFGKMPTATIEGLVLLKLFALPELYRQFDLDRVAIYEADLTQLMARSEQPDSFFLNVLSQYTSDSDLNSLRELLTEIRRQLTRLHKPT